MSAPNTDRWQEFTELRRKIQLTLDRMVAEGELRIVGETADSGPIYQLAKGSK